MFFLMTFLMLVLSILSWRQLLCRPRMICRCKPKGVRACLVACCLDATSLLVLAGHPQLAPQWVPWVTLIGGFGINALLMIAVRFQFGIVAFESVMRPWRK